MLPEWAINEGYLIPCQEWINSHSYGYTGMGKIELVGVKRFYTPYGSVIYTGLLFHHRDSQYGLIRLNKIDYGFQVKEFENQLFGG